MSGLPDTPPEPRVRAVAAPVPRRALASPAVWLVALAALALFIALSAAPARAGAEPAGLGATAPTGLTGGVDDWVHIWQVVQYATVQQTLPRQPGGPRVYYLGDSIARESTVGDAEWTLQLGRRAAAAGKAPDAVAFTVAGHNQTFGMDETIVDHLPATPDGQPKGIVLIGVGLSRFIGPPTPQAPVRVEPPPAGELPVLSPWIQHHYDDRSLLSVTRKKELVSRWMDRRWAGFKRNRAANLAAIGRIIVACKAKNLQPVIVDLPLDLAVVGNGLDKPLAAYRSGCSDLAHQYHVKYLSFGREIGLPNTAYWDIHHLVKSGYTRWQLRLTDELVRLFPQAPAPATL